MGRPRTNVGSSLSERVLGCCNRAAGFPRQMLTPDTGTTHLLERRVPLVLLLLPPSLPLLGLGVEVLPQRLRFGDVALGRVELRLCVRHRLRRLGLGLTRSGLDLLDPLALFGDRCRTKPRCGWAEGG